MLVLVWMGLVALLPLFSKIHFFRALWPPISNVLSRSTSCHDHACPFLHLSLLLFRAPSHSLSIFYSVYYLSMLLCVSPTLSLSLLLSYSLTLLLSYSLALLLSYSLTLLVSYSLSLLLSYSLSLLLSLTLSLFLAPYTNQSPAPLLSPFEVLSLSLISSLDLPSLLLPFSCHAHPSYCLSIPCSVSS